MRIFSSRRGRLFLVDGLGRLLHQADDIAHAQDAAGEPIGVKRLELVELFADAGKFDRALGHFAHGKRRAAAGVAIELGEHQAGESEGLVKMGGHAHRLLAGGGIGIRAKPPAAAEIPADSLIRDQSLVDFLPAGGIEDLDVAALLVGPFQGHFRHLEHVVSARRRPKYRHADLAGECGELIDGCRSLQDRRR